MAPRIVWWVLTVCILAVFHLSMTREQGCCRDSQGCVICKYRKATKYHGLIYRFCFSRFPFVIPMCNKNYQEEEKQTFSETCGIQPPHGQEVADWKPNKGDWPWQVSIQTSSYHHMCGGVLIDKDWVLTAAHCVDKTNAKDLHVVLGEFDLTRRSGKEQYQRIKHIFVHPNYQPRKFPNDVALIQLENDAQYNEYVSPICLSSFNDDYTSNSCFITGWGDSKGTVLESRLRVRKVSVLHPDVCKQIWLRDLRPNHICVNNGMNGVCFGDAGGPLFCVRSSDGRFVLEGVASWLDGSCQRRSDISIYTNIRTFVPWINNIMNSTKGKP